MLKGQKPDWSKWRLSTTVPVSFWAKDAKPKLKNNVAITRVMLPTGRMLPEERLKAAKDACDRSAFLTSPLAAVFLTSSFVLVDLWLKPALPVR